MNEAGNFSSRGPLTLTFTGVDDDTASEEQDEEKNNTQTQTPDSVLFPSNGNTHNLTVNSCYGNIN